MAPDLGCFHCGLPVADPLRWVVRINNQDEAMCCPACQTVAGAIIAGGLENYYQFRSQLATRPETTLDSTRSDWAAYDDPVWQAAFVQTRRQDDVVRAEARLAISNIHCAACCWLIEQAIKKFPDAAIAVNLATHQAVLCWNPAQHQLSALLMAIERVGYTALPAQTDRAQQETDKEYRRQLIGLGIAGLAMMQAMMFALALYSGDWSGMEPEQQQLMQRFSLVIIVPVIFYSALPFYRGAWRSLKAMRVGMDVPVTLALWIAFVASVTSVITQRGAVYFDSISMFVFLLLLARFAEMRVRRHFFDTRTTFLPAICHCLSDENPASALVTRPVHQVSVGEVLRVRAGEMIPLDAIIIDGRSSVDEASFSGEALPVRKKGGDPVYAGSINGDGVLTVRVTQVAGQSRFDHLARLAEWSVLQKPALTLLADKLASVFTLLVLLLAGMSALFWVTHDASRMLAVVLSILVVSCPCALSLATPAALAFFYQALRQRGALIVSGQVADKLDTVDRVVFDKTGTLTDGHFSIIDTKLFSEAAPPGFLVELAAAMEKYSGHPLASAFRHVATDIHLAEVEVLGGRGISAVFEGKSWRIGSREFCAELAGCDMDWPSTRHGNDHQHIQPVYLVRTQQWLARFDLADQLRPEAKPVIAQLQQQGKVVEILSGDSSGAAESLAAELGIAACRSQASPEQKLMHIRTLQQQGHRVMMIGDGINDIPVLAQADVSVAMPSASDLAKTHADVVLLRPSLSLVVDVFHQAGKTRGIVRQNIIWALLYNGIALPLAACGLVHPWLAAVGMSLSSLFVTFNSLRLRNL